MPYVLGVDIGSSFITAATAHFSEGNHAPTPQPVKLASRADAVESVVYVGQDGHVLVGEAAEVAGISRPERVLRDFRQRIGDAVPFTVGDITVASELVFAIIARWVVDRAEEAQGGPPDAITLTFPTTWGDHKTGLVRRALAEAGLAGVSLLREPEAAALHYASTQPDGVDGPIAVYDWGGNSFEVSIVPGINSDESRVLGDCGHIQRLGGATFDDLVFSRVAVRIGDVFTRNDPSAPAVWEALRVIRQECVNAKETLSFRADASVRVVLPGVRATVRLVRPEFEAMIDGSVRQTIEVLRQTLDTAEVTAGDLAAVLLVGGSVQIPAVARLLGEELDVLIVVSPDPVEAVSFGAALAAARAIVATGASAGQQTISGMTAEAPGSAEKYVPVTGRWRHRLGTRHKKVSADATGVPVGAPDPAPSPDQAPHLATEPAVGLGT